MQARWRSRLIEISSPRALANHRATSKYQLENVLAF